MSSRACNSCLRRLKMTPPKANSRSTTTLARSPRLAASMTKTSWTI
ncbi:Uncharacterised protein [Mycobacteroides abscessus subsp. abscessus]|nr:Uncharacterised protein [Mycobacteroides abscessus subsp. abscessus]